MGALVTEWRASSPAVGGGGKGGGGDHHGAALRTSYKARCAAALRLVLQKGVKDSSILGEELVEFVMLLLEAPGLVGPGPSLVLLNWLKNHSAHMSLYIANDPELLIQLQDLSDAYETGRSGGVVIGCGRGTGGASYRRSSPGPAPNDDAIHWYQNKSLV